jgi:hypothetical protein
VGERYADGLASYEEADAAFRAANAVCKECEAEGGSPRWWTAAAAAVACWSYHDRRHGDWKALLHLRHRGLVDPGMPAVLMRDVVENPFRPARVADAAWLAWGEGTVLRLARAAYEDRLLPSGHLDPARLAVVADALEDAGCSDAAILGHLRGKGPHVRGCWVIDVLRQPTPGSVSASPVTLKHLVGPLEPACDLSRTNDQETPDRTVPRG